MIITYGFIAFWHNALAMQLTKTEDGIKVRTDHGQEITADVVLFATGNNSRLFPTNNTWDVVV